MNFEILNLILKSVLMEFYDIFCLFIFRIRFLKMVSSSTVTSEKSNKSFYSTVFVLFIAELYVKKFEQFCLGDLLILKKNYFLIFNYRLLWQFKVAKNFFLDREPQVVRDLNIFRKIYHVIHLNESKNNISNIHFDEFAAEDFLVRELQS
jgi:hypothetical protein